MKLIASNFVRIDASRILATPIPPIKVLDRIVWMSTTNGKCTVKNAYWLAQSSNKEVILNTFTSNPRQEENSRSKYGMLKLLLDLQFWCGKFINTRSLLLNIYIRERYPKLFFVLFVKLRLKLLVIFFFSVLKPT